jgi:hypothetical protein
VTTDEAKERIGHAVIYQTGSGPEGGCITSANDRYVFVRYGSDFHSKATNPADLTFIFPASSA